MCVCVCVYVCVCVCVCSCVCVSECVCVCREYVCVWVITTSITLNPPHQKRVAAVRVCVMSPVRDTRNVRWISVPRTGLVCAKMASTVTTQPQVVCIRHYTLLLHVIRLNRPESGGTVKLCPLQSCRTANEPLFLACVLFTNCCTACSTMQAGTRDPDSPATKSVSTPVKGVCFAEQKGAG